MTYELTHCHKDALVRLAYGEDAPDPISGVADALASLAYDEIERRQGALANLLRDNPSLFAARA